MRIFYSTSAQLRFFSCGNFVSRETFTHQRRTLNCCVLILVTEGTLNITSGGKKYAVSKGEYILLPADEEHFGHAPSDSRLSYLWAHFKPIVPFEIYESGVTESFEIAIPEYGRVPNSRREMLFRQLLDFSRREDLYSEALPACSMALLLMELTQEHIDGVNGSRSSISPVIASAREWIKSNCHRQLSASDIAAEFHYNTEYFSALFKKETGMPLIGFLNKCRIEVAKNLLSSENVSIKEAAFSCGFNDEKYFMKMFRKHEGMTPMQYKNYFLVK